MGLCNEVARGEFGPVALLTKLGYVLSGPTERKRNQINMLILVIPMNHSLEMCIH